MNDIHQNGTVELHQHWRPGGAQGAEEPVDNSTSQYLFAVRLADEDWHYQITTCGYWHGWLWKEVEWYVPCSELDLPYVGGA